MRIVLKPLGAIAIVGAIVLLSFAAFRNTPAQNRSTAATSARLTNPVGTGESPQRNGSLTVYTDGLENGWQERGWAKVVDYRNASPVHGSGGTSIRVEAGPYEAVKIFHPGAPDLAGFRHFSCYVNGGDKGGQDLVLSAIAGGKNKGSVKFPPLPPKQWVRLSVPLAQLDVQGRRDFNAFWVQNMSGEVAPAFYIDDVQFTETEPVGSPGTELEFAL